MSIGGPAGYWSYSGGHGIHDTAGPIPSPRPLSLGAPASRRRDAGAPGEERLVADITSSLSRRFINQYGQVGWRVMGRQSVPTTQYPIAPFIACSFIG